jgi:hypothetical protein
MKKKKTEAKPAEKMDTGSSSEAGQTVPKVLPRDGLSMKEFSEKLKATGFRETEPDSSSSMTCVITGVHIPPPNPDANPTKND